MASNQRKPLLEQQKIIWKKAKNSAGPRYTADLNVELPIKDLFNGIGKTDSFFSEIDQFNDKLKDTFKPIATLKPDDYKNPKLRKNIESVIRYGNQLLIASDTLAHSRHTTLNLNEVGKLAAKCAKYYYPTSVIVGDFERKEEQEEKEKAKEKGKEYFGHSKSEELESLKRIEYHLRNFERASRDIEYLVKSSRGLLSNSPFLLILGEAGIGKTHLMCDVSKERIEKGLPPTFLILGEELVNIKDPLVSIMKSCGINGGKKTFLKQLNSIGQKAKSRSLIIVDAINEADRAGWKKGLRGMIKEIKKYPWVGLVITCRTPFHFLALPKRMNIITETHQGFSEYELEAMTAFFNFYGLPLPEVPLMISEFSSPLFLGSFCKTAVNLKGGRGKIARRLTDLAMGQVGMTKILEDFYINKEEEINKKYKEKFKKVIKTSWIWSKSGNACFVKMLAKEMAVSGLRYVDISSVLKIIKDLSGTNYSDKTCQKIADILIESGILIKDISWDGVNRKYKDVIKFSFHKFSDHIIARYLLADFFNSQDIAKSLTDNTPLGNLFKDEQSILTNIDIIEAIMVEFPQRIKKIDKFSDKDLVSYLPVRATYSPQFIEAYIRSLYWRVPDNFINKKGVLKTGVRNYINQVVLRSDSANELLNFMVSAAVKPLHPLNFLKLDGYLSKMPMDGRDLFWSEFLREQYRCQSVHKLISWIETHNLKKLKSEQAKAIITVLGWILTTTNRALRDRATRCIFIVGKLYPEICFSITENMITKNDPYIGERMLASCYGVSMVLNSKNENEKLMLFAKSIYNNFFKPGAKFSSTHILVRDYCKGIIDIALIKSPNLLTKTQIARTVPPYKDGGIRKWGQPKSEEELGKSPIHMDFENYTLGHLIPSRRNYDSGNKDFIKLKKNILWRIYKLGWSYEKFHEVDRQISNASHPTRGGYVGKIDRYGKKYSWIAYYEMLGLRADRKELDEYKLSEDQSRDSYPEFDPSFPIYERPKTLLFKKNLTSGPRALKKWMLQKEVPDIADYYEVEEIDGEKGPWILVHGSIGHDNKTLERKTSIFIDGVAIREKSRSKLEEFFEKVEFPGNGHIPDNPEVHSLFVGEVGWKEIATLNKKDYEDYIKILQGSKRKKLPRRATILQSLKIAYFGDDKETIYETPKAPEFVDVPIYEKVNVEIMSRWLSSKDYSKLGEENGIGLHIPNKNILKLLKLKYRPDTFDFNDLNGKLATISRFSGDQYGTHENLLYIRKDLLDAYLKKRRRVFNLLVWGERQFWPKGMVDFHREDLAEIYQKHKNIFKKVVYY